MNIDQLRAFVAVVDTGSMDVAARRLKISASAVSQRIRALETATGAVLLVRTSPVRATAAGERVLVAARQMLLIEADTVAGLATLGNGTAKARLQAVTVRLGVGDDALATWLRPFLQRAAEWDDIALHLEMADQDTAVTLLETGQAMAALSAKKTPPGGCTTEYLGSMAYRGLCTRELAAKYAHNLTHMPMVVFGPEDALQKNFLKQQGLRGARGRVHQVPASHEFAQAVCMGLGWGMVPDLQRQELSPELVPVVADAEPTRVPIYLHRWKVTSERLDRVCQAVIETAKEHMH